MNRLVSFSVSLALMAFPFVACLHADPNDEGDVRQVVSGFAETWNHHDMEAFGRLFAPDADFVNVAGNWWKGREAIQMHHAFSHGTIPADTKVGVQYGIFKTSTMRFTQIDVRLVHRTFMGTIERGESNLSFSNLVKVCQGLGITLAQLLSGLEKKAAQSAKERSS